jgi:hypothetical protein
VEAADVRRQVLVAAAGAVALALSIPLALLGRAALATPTEATSLDAPVNGSVRQHPTLAERAAARLLAADRSDRFAAVVQAYRRAEATPAVGAASMAPVRLAQLARRLGNADERSQAHVMVGAVFALPAGNGTVGFDLLRQLGGARLLEQAAAEFRAAARIDDQNEAAKYDLELLLKRDAIKRRSAANSRPAGQRPNARQARQQRRNASTRRRVEEHSAGIYSTGRGY